MASVARRVGKTVRRFFGRCRKFITNKPKKQEDVSYYDSLIESHFWERYEQVLLERHRVFGETSTEITPHIEPQRENSVEIASRGTLHSFMQNHEMAIVKSKNNEEKSKPYDTDHTTNINSFNEDFDTTDIVTHAKEQNKYDSNKLISEAEKQKQSVEDSNKPSPEKDSFVEDIESMKSHSECKIESIRDNIDWTFLDEMKQEFENSYAKRHMKKQTIGEKNSSPAQVTSKKQSVAEMIMSQVLKMECKSCDEK